MHGEYGDKSKRKKRSYLFPLSLLLLSLMAVGIEGEAVEGVDKDWRRGVDQPALSSSFPQCVNITEEQDLDHPAPDYVQTLQGSYTMVVEMTYRTQNKTYYVEEAREVNEVDGMRVNVGAVHITMEGSLVSYYYYPDQGGEMVEEMDGTCRMVGTEMPPFNPWGWWDPNPAHGDYLYGPSALFRQAFFANKRYMGEETAPVNGVTCELWQTCEGNNNIEVTYFFSEKNAWEMPFNASFSEGDGRVPVRMEVLFLDMSERIQYNILAFIPVLVNPTMVQTPRGEGCEGAVSIVPSAPLPRVPSHFSLYQELVYHPIIEGNDLGNPYQQVTGVKLTYAHPLNLIRYDYIPRLSSNSPYFTNSRLRVIHDFNTGVQYITDEHLGNCSRSRIPKGFDDDFGGILGANGEMVNPNQLFHLDDTFALVGPRVSRLDPRHGSSVLYPPSPVAHLWSSTRTDIPDPEAGGGLEDFPKAVLEYYYIKEKEYTAEGPEDLDVPARADVFVYNASDFTQVVGLRTSNIYDLSVVRQYVEDEFYVGECSSGGGEGDGALGDTTTSSFILIVFPANRKQQSAVSEALDTFRSQLFSIITQIAGISPTRIAAMEVSIDIAAPSRDQPAPQDPPRRDYGVTDTVMATVTMLERPPYSLSYVEPEGGPLPVPGDKEVLVAGTGDMSFCASACSTHRDFKCISFHLCSGSCYLSKVEGTDGTPDLSVEGCQLYVLSVSNTSVPDPPTSEVYTLILGAIQYHKVKVILPYEDEIVELVASEAFHYDGFDPDDALRRQFSVMARSNVLTYPDTTLFQVADLDACLAACIGWKEYRCVTLSYRAPDDGGDGGNGGEGGGRGSRIGGRGSRMGGRVSRVGGTNMDGVRDSGESGSFGRRAGRGSDVFSKNGGSAGRVGGRRRSMVGRGVDNREDGGGEGGGVCMLSSIHYQDLNSTALAPDTSATVYSRRYLVDYEPVLGGVALNISGPIIDNVKSLDDCARHCSSETSFTCQSFEWCFGDQVCHLHPEHFLDVEDGNYTTGTSCIHFSTKQDISFTQYPNQGWPNDKHTLAAQNTDASSCAKLCLEDTSKDVCESFDVCSVCDETNQGVCGEELLGMKNLCYLSTRHLGQPGANLLSAPKCRHYSREMFGDEDYPSWVSSHYNAIYTAEDMGWLGASMVVLGVLLTLGFLSLLVLTQPQPTSTSNSTSTSTSTSGKKADEPMSYKDLKTAMEETDA